MLCRVGNDVNSIKGTLDFHPDLFLIFAFHGFAGRLPIFHDSTQAESTPFSRVCGMRANPVIFVQYDIASKVLRSA